MTESSSCEALIDDGVIERYLAGKLSDPEVEAFESHYLTCARCQNELRLAATIRETLPDLMQADRRTAREAEADEPVTARRWLGRRERVAAVALAAAAVLAGILLIRPADMENLQHRDTITSDELVTAVESPVGPVESVGEFRWAPVTGAHLYRVTLFNDTGDVVWEADTRETHVAMPNDLNLAPGSLYLWQVDARIDWDRWVSSDLIRFSISEP